MTAHAGEDPLRDVLAEFIAEEPGLISDLGAGGGTRAARAVRRAGWVSPGEVHAAVRRAQAEALRDAAQAIYGDERAAGPFAKPLSVASWLRARADEIGADL